MRVFLTTLLFFLFASPALAGQSLPVDTGRVTATLVSSHNSVAPGESFHIALRTELDEHWHTYWRNPGDSGEPVTLNWAIPETVMTGDIYWPVPMPIATGPIINYGFEGAPLFPVKFTVSPDAEPGSVFMVDADFYYLVCKDVCIPEEGKASLPIAVGATEVDAVCQAEIDNAIAQSPVKGGVKGGVVKKGDAAIFTFENLPDGDFSTGYFFPFDQGVINHSVPQIVTLGSQGLRIESKADFLWDGDLPKTWDGILTYDKDGQTVATELSLAVGETMNIGTAAAVRPAAAAGGLTLFTAVIGALIGGLILNLMPCVFPVISMKALSLAKTAHGERAHIRREAWLYTFGVLATFLLLTLILLAVKAAGNEVGWGFQLQSPIIVGGLAILLFVIGLNLLGLFEFGAGLQNTGSGLAAKQGSAGTFFTGALAVIVATPCTAPFMAGAIGYALAQPALVTVLVFMSLAVGFALPFLLVAYFPQILSRLPKPGPWMERFKEILAFPMFGAAIWLVWVFSLQAGEVGILYLLSSMLAIAFAIWLFKRSGKTAKALGVLTLILALVLPFQAKQAEFVKGDWSLAKIEELQSEGKAVLVDFTAAWCVTCKVNEITVLNKPKTQKLLADNNTVMLIADWTNKNDEIAQELARHGRVGVPLYLYYPPRDNAVSRDGQNSVSPVILPQILTYDVLKTALQRDDKQDRLAVR